MLGVPQYLVMREICFGGFLISNRQRTHGLTMTAHALFPTLATHLQITLSPKEYLRVIREAGDSTDIEVKKSTSTIADYWRQLPEYVIARCPFCGAAYRERLDTHSLKYWHISPEQQRYTFSTYGQTLGCQHFVATQAFVNLNGHFYETYNLLEMPIFVNDNGDIPFVFPKLLPATLPSIGVMHSLPICDLEHNQFVPRYSLYLITYYAEDPQTVKAYRWQGARRQEDEYYILLEFPAYMRRYPETADLQQWVVRGKLQWLDPFAPALPLTAGPTEAFPYTGITGYGQRYVYRPTPVIDTTPRWAFWPKRNLAAGGHIELR